MPLILNGTTGVSGIDGSAGTPSYVGGDSDTGLWYPAANTVALSTSGSERLRIDSAGDVGIGSTNPTRKLQISQSIATTYTGDFDDAPNQLYIVNTNTTTNAYTGLQMDVGSNSQCAISAIRTGDGEVAMAFGTRVAGVRAERMRIDSFGNVGIGTTSVTSGFTFEVKGGLPAIFNNVSAANSPTYGGTIFYRGTNTTNNGVGFGFQLNNSSSAAVEYAYIGGLIETNTAGSQNGAIIFAPTSANSRTERMRITSGGNLLVGTTATLGAVSHTFFGSATTLFSCRNTNAAANNYFEFGHDSNNNFRVTNQSATGVYLTNGGTSWIALSDENSKTDLHPITNAAEKVSTLRAVIGRYKTDHENISRAFLIAQDVQKVLPEAVNENADGSLGLSYTEIIPLLVAAIKEQQAMIEELKAKVAALEK